MTDRPIDEQSPLITVSSYTRTLHVRSVTFTCLGCRRAMTEERRPGPLPRYCQACSTDPVRIRERARERKRAQRHGWSVVVPTQSANVTEPARPVTPDFSNSVAALVPVPAERTPADDEDRVALVLVPGQLGLQRVTAADLGLPPISPHLPEKLAYDEALALPAPLPPARRPRRQQTKPALAVRFPGGQTHWLAATYRTGCGRRVGGAAMVIKTYWVTCSVCDRKDRPTPAADAPSLLTAAAAERLLITPQRLTVLARDGVLGQKVGRSWVFTAKELATYKRRQKGRPAQTITRRPPAARPSGGRVSRADMEGAYLLDHLLEEERALEQRYALPFRAPQQTATTIHACPRCGQDMVFLIFGDRATDEAGLLAYGRLLDAPICKQNLITFVIGPPQGPAQDDDTPSLVLQVWPTIGTVESTTP